MKLLAADRLSDLIDREQESAELWSLGESGEPRLAMLYGRRRVGKTYLLTRLWDRETAFYFTASNTSPEINRRVLIEEAERWSGTELRPGDYPTWRSLFRMLLELQPDRNIVIILDEFQYLANDEKGLSEVASELNAVWEGGFRRSAGILVVLSGSAASTLEELASGGSPLYGRLDWRRQLQPFDYFDAGQMLAKYSLRDRIESYAAFGGLPKYLRALDQSRSLAENIVRLLLEPHGEVRLQLETILSQEEGVRENATYQGILESVGIKRRPLGEIAAMLARTVDTPLRRMVGQLVELGLLQLERDFSERGTRALRYRIADPALRFYYGMVLPNESAIASSGARAVWRERLAKEAFPAYAGQHVFEDVVAQAYRRWRALKGLPAVEEWGRWSGKDRDRRDMELDFVVRLLDGRMMTGSAKFRKRKADVSVLFEHLDALKRLSESGRAWAREALEPDSPLFFVSAHGFTDSFFQAADDLSQPLIAWTLDDIFRR
ncbi:MAG: ATP-binding protein [Trueperaceae bacterium]